ncbi:probable leucine-rich repeat receptor-like protein kinase At1g35710 [Durio zibethinus]|uniref:Probable leucine-rich repeat receptor-like protein kinase At1g35710 n=1 Tax=Durio zibethinus TaxID=66656 RepID=A0A6P6ALJ6_DURZI|nr:probable leucine-rich repeat receptor-like protein kinase At1g35710 [Durio zibethinus]
MASFLISFQVLLFLMLLSVQSSYVFASSAAAAPGKEAETLLKWKASLDNNSQTLLSSLWVGDSHCNWVGITCDKGGSITNLRLRDYGFKGTLHSLNFLSFPNLMGLHLPNNSLYGSIPSHIGNLPKLTELDLSKNNFPGNIPSNIGRLLSSLSILYLHENYLTGPIPISIGSLHNLSRLVLVDNRLSGSIPKEVGMMRSLVMLDLSVNYLTGPIPASLGNLSNLLWLYLYNNNLSGYIPNEIGQLASLTTMQLSSNNLTGVIPNSIGNLTKFLSGFLPPTLSNVTHLESLQLSDNHLSGPLPENVCLGGQLAKLTSKGEHLGIRWDFLRNFIQEHLDNDQGQLGSLITMQLLSNNLTGVIPAFIGNLTKLSTLYLFKNKLFGSIRQEIGMLVSLTELIFFDNNFSGSIPASIGNLTSLSTLYLDQNMFFGSIPTSIGNMMVLSLLYNHLSGPIPSFSNLTHLESFQISDNHLGSPLPENVCLGGQLIYLGAINNNLTGLNPSSLRNCKSFYIVRLEGKQLTENISEAFSIYPNLNYIALSNNNFYGELSSNWVNAIV